MYITQEYANYLKKTFLFVILGIVICILFVIVVDPYRIYGFVNQTGFNEIKPRPDRYQEQIKLVGAKRSDANALILGNSRAEIGFNPDDTSFKKNAYVGYNLAIPGSGIAVAHRQLSHMRNVNTHPKLIILGLDFLDFLEPPEKLTQSKENGETITKVSDLKWQFDLAFSVPSVIDGFKTLRIQKSPDAETITSTGFNPLLEYDKYAKQQGYHALFKQRAEENARSYTRKRHFVVSSAVALSERWRELKSILAIAREDKVPLHLVIYPYHAQILLMFEQAGLMPAFEQWKRQLVDELNNITNQDTESKVHLWDFTGFSNIQCEAIPEKSDKVTETKWYWEAGHFKAALGSVMLQRMFERSEKTINSFGFYLNSTNLSTNSQRIQMERSACIRRSPELLDDVNQLMKIEAKK